MRLPRLASARLARGRAGYIEGPTAMDWMTGYIVACNLTIATYCGTRPYELLLPDTLWLL